MSCFSVSTVEISVKRKKIIEQPKYCRTVPDIGDQVKHQIHMTEALATLSYASFTSSLLLLIGSLLLYSDINPLSFFKFCLKYIFHFSLSVVIHCITTTMSCINYFG